MSIIRDDLYRYTGDRSFKSLVKSYLRIPGFRYTYWMRKCKKYRGKKIFLPYYAFCRLMLNHYSFKYGIQIPYDTKIGKGFYIGHFSCIVVNGESIIGNNVNISQGVTIGMANRGKNKGFAIIGNNVYIGPGVKIVGHVAIGNNVAIGANAVVTKDIPDNAVVVGIPAKIISYDGATGYVNRCV